MKRFVVVCFVLVGAFLANAQTIQLSPLKLGGSYIQHIRKDGTVTVSKVPEWKRTAKPSYRLGVHDLSALGYIEEDSNWIEIKVKDFSTSSVGNYYSLSKDSAGNVWIVYTPYSIANPHPPQLFAMLDCDIKTIEDVVGDYWVSWKLIEGTRDIYPVLHKE